MRNGPLQKEKTNLEEELDAAKPRIKDQLEARKFQQEMQFLRQFHASTPDEYKAAYQASQQQQPPTQQRQED